MNDRGKETFRFGEERNETLVMSTQTMAFQVALSSTRGSVSLSAMSKDTTP